MIREWIEAWRTPASPAARRLGYLYETIAFNQRRRRCESSWREHVQQSHEAILESAMRIANPGTLLILGSGSLFEIPMTELKSLFDRVILVDLVHPLHVRAAWESRAGVELIEADMLGMADALMAWRPGQDLPSPRPPDWRDLKPDLILSANCLSQLALLPRQRIEKRGRGKVGEAALDGFSSAISQAHLRHLRSFGVPHLVISDFETRVRDASGFIIETARPFFDAAEMRRHREWIWKIAPRGESNRLYEIEMSVGAFTLSDV